jgi:hypothetical protein
MNKLKAFIASLILGLGTLLGILLMGNRVKKAEAEAATVKKSLSEISKKAEGLGKTLGESAKVEEKANEERKELSGTPDSDLVNRANNLF